MVDRNTTGAAVRAEALSLRGARGWVYRDVGFEAPPGALVALEGEAGTGRTSLLLTLAGRMRPTGGTVTVDGLDLPRQAARVRRIAALGPVPGVNEPDPALSVAAHLREQLHLHGRPFAPLVRRGADRRATDALAAAGLDPAALPDGLHTPARELGALDRLRLSTALALIGAPRLLCADDIDDRLDDAGRRAAWQLLRDIADRGTTVLATTTDAGRAAGLADLTARTVPAENPAETAAAPEEEAADARA
ncbi:ATP-binding cassette domain-containing protein [Kitasatospora sp. NPDC085879]|uniref:ABC transporter ATP-binding protein n=1 Tax=Kitasatospora sp. NPDC085879 TaxID=3154769 RepID=UPI00341A8D45